jgi:hypothetical protein
MPEPDYFQMAKEITDNYIASMKIVYLQGKIDGGQEMKKKALDILGGKK